MDKRIRVLIVDDVEDDALLMVEALREGQFTPVWKWVNGRAALEASLKSEAWDLIFADYSMPGFDGLEALRMVRESSIDVPVVIVSGTIGEERTADLLNAGASDCVLKTNLMRMPPVVERVLAAAEANREHRRTQLALRASNRALRMLSEVNRAVVGGNEESALLQQVCDIVTRIGRFPLTWVGYARKDDAKTIEPVASSGSERAYLGKVSFSWSEEKLGAGPSGTAIRTGRPVSSWDVGTDPRLEPWRDAARSHGLQSSVALPIDVRDEHLAAVLCIYSSEPRAFFPEEVEVLEDLARSLGTGVEILRTRKARKEAERHLQQAQRLEAIGRLAGGIAHDFNNMLFVIINNAEFLLDELPMDEPLRADVLEIQKAASRSAVLTQKLLAFSRKQLLAPEVLNLDTILDDVERMLHRVIGEDIELFTVPAGNLRNVRVDRTQIEQVLMNLAINARDAMPSGGRLTIGTSNVELEGRPKYVQLSVSDTGVGMSEEVRGMIFEPFFTTKGELEGTGLGLPMVHGIVEQSGGWIEVDSAPGMGSTFSIYLPACDDAPAPTVMPESVRPVESGSRKTVLLVEDEHTVRIAAKRILEKAGYEVLVAANGGEALMLCEGFARPIHLLLTDVVMPFMNGRAVAERLRQLKPEMRVLYMSGYTENAIAHRGELDADAEFIAKPFTRKALARKVLEVLR
jgi:signal transduction histidine kinase/DNA-binding response OmpR family regulator